MGDDQESFEDAFRRLQEVVQRLSEGNLSLQEALSSFEEGMELADRCGGMLEEAELRVKRVSDRALKSATAAVAQLEQSMRGTTGAEIEGITIEIEQFESTLLFDTTGDLAQGLGRGRGASGKNSHPALELDPLFDEDD